MIRETGENSETGEIGIVAATLRLRPGRDRPLKRQPEINTMRFSAVP